MSPDEFAEDELSRRVALGGAAMSEPRHHTLGERLRGRHDWVVVDRSRFPLGVTILREECWCGKRRERWHEWKDGEEPRDD